MYYKRIPKNPMLRGGNMNPSSLLALAKPFDQAGIQSKIDTARQVLQITPNVERAQQVINKAVTPSINLAKLARKRPVPKGKGMNTEPVALSTLLQGIRK
jgi:hypothetical protein